MLGDKVEVAQLLLSPGADVNSHPHSAPWGETALQTAVRHGNIALVLVLLSHGAKVDAPAVQNSTYTALERAAHTESGDHRSAVDMGCVGHFLCEWVCIGAGPLASCSSFAIRGWPR